MAGLAALLGVAPLLVAVGLIAPGAGWSRRAARWLAALGLVATVVTTLGATGAATGGPVRFALDGVGAPVLAALFLLSAAGAAGAAPVWAAGLIALALLATDVVAMAVLLAPLVFCWRRLAGPVGALLAFGLVARLMLDWAGAVTPGWWGVPVLLLATLAAMDGARRAAMAETGSAYGEHATRAWLAVAGMGLGAALLARGADLPGAAAWSVAAAQLQVGVAAVAGALFAGVQQRLSIDVLVRSGGALRRAPLASAACGVALLALAAVPGTPGFAGGWAVLQALLTAGRGGGTAVLLLTALAVAGLGVTAALLAVAAGRVLLMVLPGAPRSARAAAVADPGRLGRAGLAVAAAVMVVLGCGSAALVAWLPPGAGAPAWTMGWVVLAPGPDGMGYAGWAVAMLVVAGAAVAAMVAAPGRAVAAWPGGAQDDADPWRGSASMFAWPVSLWPVSARVVVAGLVVVLAATLGWAAR